MLPELTLKIVSPSAVLIYISDPSSAMAQAEGGGKPGAFESLAPHVEVRNSECLNESDEHPFANCLEVGRSMKQASNQSES